MVFLNFTNANAIKYLLSSTPPPPHTHYSLQVRGVTYQISSSVLITTVRFMSEGVKLVPSPNRQGHLIFNQSVISPRDVLPSWLSSLFSRPQQLSSLKWQTSALTQEGLFRHSLGSASLNRCTPVDRIDTQVTPTLSQQRIPFSRQFTYAFCRGDWLSSS